MNIEKSVNSFVDSIYDDYFNPQLNRFLPNHWLGEWIMETYDLDKKQFKDLLMNTTGVDSMDVTNLVCDFNTKQQELTKLWDVMRNIGNLFETETWLGDGFSDDVDNNQIVTIQQIMKILKVEEVV